VSTILPFRPPSNVKVIKHDHQIRVIGDQLHCPQCGSTHIEALQLTKTVLQIVDVLGQYEPDQAPAVTWGQGTARTDLLGYDCAECGVPLSMPEHVVQVWS
jgi:hypothetical protein